MKIKDLLPEVKAEIEQDRITEAKKALKHRLIRYQNGIEDKGFKDFLNQNIVDVIIPE